MMRFVPVVIDDEGAGALAVDASCPGRMFRDGKVIEAVTTSGLIVTYGKVKGFAAKMWEDCGA